MMTGRQRILAALERRPVDRLPFVPLIDVYTLKDMPASIPKTVQSSGYAYAAGMLAASRALGCDILLRHVPASDPRERRATYLDYLGPFDSTVQITSETVDGVLTETLRTPVGKLVGTWGFTGEVGWIPHPLKHLVTNGDELRVFHFAVDHLSGTTYTPDPTAYRRINQELGEDGLATVSLMNTPLMYLIEMVWGLQNTYYLLADYRSEVEDILAKLHAAMKRYTEQVLANSPARVVIQYENTSSTLLSPKVFRQYCLPCLNEYADILTQAGKIHLVHMCGKLKVFMPDISGARFAGVADIAPSPTGDMPLDQAAAQLSGKVVIGGIDPTTFIDPDRQTFTDTVAKLIQAVKGNPGVLLGSADTTPRGTPVENLRIAMELAQTAGAY